MEHQIKMSTRDFGLLRAMLTQYGPDELLRSLALLCTQESLTAELRNKDEEAARMDAVALDIMEWVQEKQVTHTNQGGTNERDETVAGRG